ncbi:hypothetical protein PoB_007069300 [Plakobranchus ocellatus]|uniref:Alpha-1,4-N-acetylglucosaminyltransferase n=1 Tax=Plakobranchus ocellatus TaxID=259542 RepID=A0AAV4DIY5_9GAST|nr:hypothetical protein PoB_007069300 [Plakobranchus ocellatus]
MAVLRCKLNLSSILIFCVVFVGKCGRFLGKAWNFVGVYHCHIGIVTSVTLAIMNIYVFNQGSHRWQLPRLPHGFVPQFPSHYFRQPLPSVGQESPDFNQLTQHLDRLDAYFDRNIVQNSLDSNVPPIIHIVWCETGPFKYSHYLSVLSAFKILKPSVLNLHVVESPYKDPDGYYQFLYDLQRDLPPLLIKQLRDKRACYASGQARLNALLSLIGREGGIALSANVLLVPSSTISSELLAHKISIGQSSNKKDPLIVFLQSNVFEDSSHVQDLTSSAKLFDCTARHEQFVLSTAQVCVQLEKFISPRMIFEAPKHLDYLLRWIGYGTSRELVPKPADDVIVPNIVHYVWLGKREFKFFAYLSVISALYVLRAEVVYVHGDYEPQGELWLQVRQEQRVKFITRKFPSSVYGQPIVKFASHASDYLRADLLLRYGGVYADWDVIFLKEMTQLMRRHNTTANVDWPETGAFPDVFNLGVLIAAPGAPFLRHFLESYRWYLDASWSYNAIHIPYKVYEKIPWSLNVDRHVQVLCARHKCHATWLHDYKSANVDHLGAGKIDFTKDALAIHWTYPDPPDFESRKSLLKGTSAVARIGQYVLQKAGKLNV